MATSRSLTEADHIDILKRCCEQRENFKKEDEPRFWSSVNVAFQRETGLGAVNNLDKVVNQLVEKRRSQISDWENGAISQQPGGRLNDWLDSWMDFLKTRDSDTKAEDDSRQNAIKPTFLHEGTVLQEKPSQQQPSFISQTVHDISGMFCVNQPSYQ